MNYTLKENKGFYGSEYITRQLEREQYEKEMQKQNEMDLQ